jgi:hypothetical protein
MLVENRWLAEVQFACGLLCRQVLRLRKLCSHFVLSILRGNEQLKTVRDGKGWTGMAETKVLFEKPLRIEWGSSLTEVLPHLILLSP